MSLPDEKLRALTQTRNFLRDLLDPKKTPRVPKKVRTEAYWALKHYPPDFEITAALEKFYGKCLRARKHRH